MNMSETIISFETAKLAKERCGGIMSHLTKK